MNIRKIFSKDTAILIASVFLGLLFLSIIYLVPVYVFSRPETTTGWLLNVGILVAFKMLASPVFLMICEVYDRVYFWIFKKKRKAKQLSLWKEWLCPYADKIQSEIKDIDRNNAAEKITKIAKEINLRAIADKVVKR